MIIPTFLVSDRIHSDFVLEEKMDDETKYDIHNLMSTHYVDLISEEILNFEEGNAPDRNVFRDEELKE